jgi:HSP20 family protein
MAVNRWDPFGETTSLRDAMNRLFEESVIRPTAAMPNGRGAAALLDVYEDGESYVVEIALPGVSPDNVEVTVLGNAVTVRGEWPARPEGRNYLHAERGGGRFERSISLPTELDANKAEAHAEHGVLRLTLPKAETARPKRIQLKTGA